MGANEIVAFSLLPYLALYCRSAQEFFGEKIIENELDRQINDIRNGLKIYSQKYKKAKDTTEHLDKSQDQIFKNMLRFSFMKSWNLHYNLGVYFDAEGHIIGNTQMFPLNNTWVFRIEYIVAHYAWSGLKKVKQHYDNKDGDYSKITDDIKGVIESGTALFPSEFRNCMMHYDLCNKGNAVIFEEMYRPEESFYGLCESCFEGKSYIDFALELRTYMLQLEKYLSSWFHVDIRKLKWDL